MEDHNQTAPQDQNSPTQPKERNEPVRTRWTPKPEQILILESVFNSGMVNPPKEETVRIRKLLEKFGPVGDANVFYWFQNRRSRSRRRQRQMHAAAVSSLNSSIAAASAAVGDHHDLQQHRNNISGCAVEFNYCGGYGDSQFLGLSPNSSSCYDGSSSSSSSSNYGLVDNQFGGSNSGNDQVFSFSSQMGVSEIDHNCPMGSYFGNSDSESLQYHSGIITVFINGVATELPGGPIDVKTMFGTDVALVHSSGITVPFNDYGFTIQGLHHGESYFLVSRPT